MMRALAVLMMVEGHTVDAFLSDSFRDTSSASFNIWLTIRGFTAPIFMFTSGVAFTYLLRLNKEPFFQNPRVKKGIFRFITLVLIAYLLRYPTYTFFNFSVVTREQWMTFFTVDALHLIGFGILFILMLALIAEKLKLNDWLVFTAGALFFFLMFSVTEKIVWTKYFPIPFAAYFYHGTGSLFPFFPWAGYVICGAVLGSYLAHNPNSFGTKKFCFQLFAAGVTILIVAAGIEIVENIFYDGKTFWTDNLYVITLRLGGVLILNSIMSFIALRIKTLPELVKQVGRHTLLIYAVHVIIIYGSAWIPGFDMILHKKMNVVESSIAAVFMIVLMMWMVVLLEKYKLYRKDKLAAAEI
jgi:uncharacterized membrane protein